MTDAACRWCGAEPGERHVTAFTEKIAELEGELRRRPIRFLTHNTLAEYVPLQTVRELEARQLELVNIVRELIMELNKAYGVEA